MPDYTEFLGLLKKDPVADAADTFNIQTMLNDNWERIDTAVMGKARVVTGSYIGTGTSGSQTPVELTFDGIPAFAMITMGKTDSRYIIWHEGVTSASLYGRDGSLNIARKDRTLSWYTDSYDASYQFNNLGTKYYYVAVLMEG